MSFHQYPPLILEASLGGGDKTVVDDIDGGAFEVTGAQLIPRSSQPPLQLVANLAADISEIQVVSDIGEFCNLYSDAAGTNKIASMVLTPDETVKVVRPAGSEIYIRAVKDVDIDQPGSFLAMNFIG